MFNLSNYNYSTANVCLEKLKTGSYRVRISFNGKRYSHGIGKIDRDKTFNKIKGICDVISDDILLGKFNNYTWKKDYFNISVPSLLEFTVKTYNIKEILDDYIEIKKEKICNNTLKDYLKSSQILSKLPEEMLILNFDDPLSFLSILRSVPYKDKYIKNILRCVNASINYSLGKNQSPYQNLKEYLNLKQKEIECYSQEEINIILSAFQENKYQNPYSIYEDSYYYSYVKFISLTGCRPEEAIALEWKNIIKRQDSRLVIFFAKAYSGRELKTTKTGDIRYFPCNLELQKLLEKQEKNTERVFPSIYGGYINQGHFSTRQWKKIINNLYQEEQISKQLVCYTLRHSFIKHRYEEGITTEKIAGLVDNSSKTILKYYLNKNNVDHTKIVENIDISLFG